MTVRLRPARGRWRLADHRPARGPQRADARTSATGSGRACADSSPTTRAVLVLTGAGRAGVLRGRRPQGDGRRRAGDAAAGLPAAVRPQHRRAEADDRRRQRRRVRGRFPARPSSATWWWPPSTRAFAVTEVQGGPRVRRGPRRCRGWSAPRVALEILLTGDPVDARRGRTRSGWSTGWSRPPSCASARQALATRIAANAPLSVRGGQAHGLPVGGHPRRGVRASRGDLGAGLPLGRRTGGAGGVPGQADAGLDGEVDGMPVSMAALRRRPGRGVGRAARAARPARRGGLAAATRPRRAGRSPTRSRTSPTSTTSPCARRLQPEAFAAEQANPDAEGGVGRAAHRDLSGRRLLTWFDDARARLLAAFRGLDPALRVPWFGPPMSAASSLTARIMETWAHGQDVADTVGVRPRADGPAAARRAHRGRRAGVQLRRATGGRCRRADPGGARRARRRHVDLGARGRAPTGSPGPRWTSACSSRSAATRDDRALEVERARRDRVDGAFAPGLRGRRAGNPACAGNVARAADLRARARRARSASPTARASTATGSTRPARWSTAARIDVLSRRLPRRAHHAHPGEGAGEGPRRGLRAARS